jgi:putative SOS response-associated peptidase YedK
MAGWLSFLRWLRFENKGRRYSFPLDHHRLVVMMRDFEEMTEQKSKVLSDEEKVYSVRVNKNDKVFF